LRLMQAMSIGVQYSKIKEGKAHYKYFCLCFNKAECNYRTIEKEILAIIRGN